MSDTAQTSGGSAQSKSSEATLMIPINQEQQRYIIAATSSWQSQLHAAYSMRAKMEEIDKEYMRTADRTDDTLSSRARNKAGDTSKLQNVTVPIIMPQTSAAHTYLSNVFLTGYPLFPVTADPDNEDAALQIETIIQENATTKGWAQQIQMFFRDGLKYNMHALECDWIEETNWTIENDVTKPNSAGHRKVLWEGNVVRRLDLYNSFWDHRVPLSTVHKDGDYVGYTELYSRTRFKEYCNSLYNIASKPAVIAALSSSAIQSVASSSGFAPFTYYLPYINPDPMYNSTLDHDWMAWMQNSDRGRGGNPTSNMYAVTKVYARIIPADFGLNVPQRNTPQIWKFIIVNGQVVLTAERMTNVHNFIPIFFGQPIEDGLRYQTKSFASNVLEMQQIASALWTSVLQSRRRAVSDRAAYDPSRVNAKDMNDPGAAAKIPVRQSAFGKPVSDAFHVFPYRDEQSDALMQSANAIVGMANLINGQNPASQGQFTKGNRTRHEYDDIMGHGNGVNQQLAQSIEYQVFTPLKEVLKLNILQYQEQKTLFNTGKKTTVNVQPTDLRKASVHFKVSDGLIPTDKITGDDLLQTVMQQFGSSPQLAAAYDLPKAFSYLMKTQGLDLTPFEKTPEQMQYEQQLTAWQNAAAQAAKAGTEFSTPMPQPNDQLKQQQQQRGSPGGIVTSGPGAALESTQS